MASTHREDESADRRSRTVSPSPPETLVLRALVTSKDAGVIIGKGGKNIADLRDETGVKAGVSKGVPGVQERVLTVSGDPESVAKAYHQIITQLMINENPSSPAAAVPPASTTMRLLISHNLMGTVIGRSGSKIKAIQDSSGVRMVAAKEMLPQSTERIVEVTGTADAIGMAIGQIGKCLLEDWERGQGTVLFHPGVASDDRVSAGRRSSNGFSSGPFNGTRRANGRTGGSPTSPPQGLASGSPQQAANLRTQNISIPSDMVGCIIGRHGSKITEIRRLSGSKISIAKDPHDDTGERMFTIVGTPEANEKALFLLYNQLESEKERRVGREAQASGSA